MFWTKGQTDCVIWAKYQVNYIKLLKIAKWPQLCNIMLYKLAEYCVANTELTVLWLHMLHILWCPLQQTAHKMKKAGKPWTCVLLVAIFELTLATRQRHCNPVCKDLYQLYILYIFLCILYIHDEPKLVYLCKNLLQIQNFCTLKAQIIIFSMKLIW